MSTPLSRFTSICFVFFACMAGSTNAIGQGFVAEISIDTDRAVALVQGKFESAGTDYTHVNLSFAGSVSGHGDIAKRIRGVEIFDRRGGRLPLRKMIDGEYLAEAGVVSWRYEVDLKPLPNPYASAHTSWISGDKGLLMLADILPTNEVSGRLTLRPPSGWSIFSTDFAGPENVFDIRDSGQAVFAIGRGWQKVEPLDPKINTDLLVSGRWHFTPTEAAEMALEISRALKKVVGENGGTRRQIILAHFPLNAGPGNWQAETRGNTVTIISSDMPFRTQSLQRLHEQLRHELFHLWIPNGVNLSGSYDWFYEGFALYESLKLGVGLNRIRFEDFLDTLSRAHTIDNVESQRTSLIRMSVNRFSGASTQIYARGMLVAFLCDLALLQNSKGKRSVENILAEFVGTYRRPSRPVDANTAVLGLLKTNPVLIPIVDKYITGSDKLDWAVELAGVGIEDRDAGPWTDLRVKEKLNGRQKALLDKLGYNNWRKLSPNSK